MAWPVPSEGGADAADAAGGGRTAAGATVPVLLQTKLHVPVPRGTLVPRSRLIEQLGRALDGKLTIVAAPAGFGKTTLLSAWLATGGLA